MLPAHPVATKQQALVTSAIGDFSVKPSRSTCVGAVRLCPEKRGICMKRYLLAAVAAAAIAAPAQARDGQVYAGIEGGIMFPREQDVNADLDFTTTQTPATPLAPAGPADVFVDDAMEADWNRGYDVDAIIGYDFGAF